MYEKSREVSTPAYPTGLSLTSSKFRYAGLSTCISSIQTRFISNGLPGPDATKDASDSSENATSEIERLPMPPGITAKKFGLYEILDSSQDWNKISGLNAIVAAHGPEELWVPEGTNNEGAAGGVFAVIATNGTQYKVMPGDVLYTMRQKGDINEMVEFRDVLAVGAYDWSVIGRPLIRGASVTATIEEQTLSGKVMVTKFKKRKGYLRRKGHRQPITRMRIEEVKYEFPEADKIVPYEVQYDPRRPPVPNHERRL